MGELNQLVAVDVAHPVGNFFQAGHLEVLPLLNGGDEVGRFHHRIVGPGVEPGIAAAHQLDVELALFEVDRVDVGDFEFAAGRRLDVLGDVDHLVVVEVQPRYRVVRLRLGWLFFDRNGVHLVVEFHHPEAFRIVDVVAKDGRPAGLLGRRLNQLGQAGAVVDVVAEDQADRIVTDEVLAEDEGFSEAVWLFLDLVGEVQAQFGAVAQQLLEEWHVVRG